MSSKSTVILALAATTLAQSTHPGVSSPVAKTCGPSTANIVCLDRYASVLPYHFSRNDTAGVVEPYPFGSTSVPNDTSFGLVQNADFLVFDQDRAFELLGESPTHDFMFEIPPAVHEAPVYVPGLNKLFFSQLSPGFLPQYVVDLNQDPPTLGEFVSDPPVYAPNGGTFHDGLIYWGKLSSRHRSSSIQLTAFSTPAVAGGNTSINGTEQRPGIRTLDPRTNKTTTLLNNYYGHYFNGPDDLFVDATGAIWFTDPINAWLLHITDTPPQLPAATYRFDPATGAVTLVDDSLSQPNGIALSPDGKHVYIGDTGAISVTDVASGSGALTFDAAGPRTVYKFDIVDNGTHISGKKPLWLSQDWIPDGLKVAANGFVLAGTGNGVDVLDPLGVLVVRVQANYTVQNFAWVGEGLSEFWMVGQGGVSRIRWELKGQDLAKSTA